VGHTGTLDPFATGLLVILVGRATRLSQYLVGLDKVYEGTIRLGVSTDTHDLTGEVTATVDSWGTLDRDRLHEEVKALTGRTDQRPPRYSAKKVGGQRAHRLARKGEVVELPSREIEVFDFSVVSIVGADLDFRCSVSSGTYVRALARDLGGALGCGAHLRSLRRTAVGKFRVEEARTLPDIEEFGASIGSPAEAVEHLPRLSIDNPDVRKKVVHGQPIPATGSNEELVALIDGQQLIGIAERSDDMFKPRVVMEG